MTAGSGDLSRRREEVRDMRPAMSPIIQFSLDQIKRHFDENMAAIASLSDVAKAIAAEKPHDAEAIWRAQLILAESALDFYLHELSKIGIQKMFSGDWTRTDAFNNLKVPMAKVMAATENPESMDWLLEYANDKVSHEIYLEPGDIRKQCTLMNINFDEVCDKFGSSFKSRLKELYQRRNQIAHQTDRRHEDACLEAMTSQIAVDAIQDIQHFVEELHMAAIAK